ncbi:MAG: class I tRNA ligase family protein, partial [Candidatus Diapherotrites archaeon]|nr:class I tRNA ligase family protein [Candidatus Diapherotrites archaeon]
TDFLESFKVVVRNPRDVLHENKGLKIVVPSASQKDYVIALENNLKVIQNVKKFESVNKKVDLNNKVLKTLNKEQILLEKAPSKVFSQNCLFCGSKTEPLLGNHWMVRAVDFNFELIKSLDLIEFEPVGSKEIIKKNLMATDFPISRADGSGIPLPFWVCDRCGKIEVIESISELYEKSNKNNQFSDNLDAVNDLFTGFLRKITWGCSNCSNGTVKWVDQILSRSFELAVTPFLIDCKEDEFKSIDFALANKADKMHLLLLFPFAVCKKPFFSKIYCTNYPNLQNKSQLSAIGKSKDALRIASLLDNSIVVDNKLVKGPDEFISALLKLHVEMVYFFSFEFNPE